MEQWTEKSMREREEYERNKSLIHGELLEQILNRAFYQNFDIFFTNSGCSPELQRILSRNTMAILKNLIDIRDSSIDITKVQEFLYPKALDRMQTKLFNQFLELLDSMMNHLRSKDYLIYGQLRNASFFEEGWLSDLIQKMSENVFLTKLLFFSLMLTFHGSVHQITFFFERYRQYTNKKFPRQITLQQLYEAYNTNVERHRGEYYKSIIRWLCAQKFNLTNEYGEDVAKNCLEMVLWLQKNYRDIQPSILLANAAIYQLKLKNIYAQFEQICKQYQHYSKEGLKTINCNERLAKDIYQSKLEEVIQNYWFQRGRPYIPRFKIIKNDEIFERFITKMLRFISIHQRELLQLINQQQFMYVSVIYFAQELFNKLQQQLLANVQLVRNQYNRFIRQIIIDATDETISTMTIYCLCKGINELIVNFSYSIYQKIDAFINGIIYNRYL